MNRSFQEVLLLPEAGDYSKYFLVIYFIIELSRYQFSGIKGNRVQNTIMTMEKNSAKSKVTQISLHIGFFVRVVMF